MERIHVIFVIIPFLEKILDIFRLVITKSICNIIKITAKSSVIAAIYARIHKLYRTSQED